jgi:hypothetical protein
MIRFMPSERTIALFSAMSNGSMTICVQADAQPAAQRCNWPLAPKGGDFSYISSHLPKAAITDGPWTVRGQCGRGETRVTRMSAPGSFSDLARRPTFVRNVSKSGNRIDRVNRFVALGSLIGFRNLSLCESEKLVCTASFASFWRNRIVHFDIS